MTQPTPIANVALDPKAHVYFDGKCVSHSFTRADGRRQSAGVVLPAELTFTTQAAEVMECVAGTCEYRLAGNADWQRCSAGESFRVPANSAFDIRVTGEPFHYLCHYG